MTEQRYDVKRWHDESAIYDDEELFAVVDVRIQANTICDRLNEQDAKIKELEHRIKELTGSD